MPMWAPWRMEYIAGPRAPGCIFCNFASAANDTWRELLVLHVEEHALVALNRYPFAAGHLMVAPRRHVGEPFDLEAHEWDAVTRLMRETAARLKRGVNAEALNLGFNVGKAAGAGIAEHLHGHVVPRWSGDTNFLPVLTDVRVMPEHLDATWSKLRPLFEDLG
jgi:ATP adenylyltransferase